jgi:outer membrane protein
MKMKILLAATMLCCQISIAQQNNQWTLQECIEFAYDNNLTVQRAELALDDAEVLLKRDKLQRLPNVDASVFNSWRWGRSIDPTTNTFTTERINSNGLNASAGVTLYNGNRQMNAIRQSQKLVEAGFYDLEDSKNDIALLVTSNYLNVILAREQLQIARNQLETTNTQFDLTKKQVEAGALPITNQLNLQAELASNEVELINRENDVDLALLQLKQTLQIPGSDDFDIVSPDIEPQGSEILVSTEDEIYEKALTIQPNIRSANLNIESAELGVRIAKGFRIPTLTLGGQVFTNYSSTQDIDGRRVPEGSGTPMELGPQPIGFVEGTNVPVLTAPRTIYLADGYPITDQWLDNRSSSLGFNLSIPIFTGWNTMANIQRAKIQKEYADISALETKNQMRQNIETAYNDARAASKVYQAAQVQVTALEESFRATERSYNLGATTFVDYQLISNNLFRAKADLARAKYNYIFTVQVLNFYVGNEITLD